MTWTLQTDCDACGSPRCAFRIHNGYTERLCDEPELESMLEGYLECALWSTTECDEQGNMGEPLDSTYDPSDVHDDRWLESLNDCSNFREQCARDLRKMDPSRAGHDFWLTRNRHGAGFWDRGLGAKGQRLTDAAHVYGSVDLYPDGNGKVR